ncbi:MAG: hypothetical protein ACJ77K_17600 [Bacteroidia bacterium]|jgi:hypothetical protein
MNNDKKDQRKPLFTSLEIQDGITNLWKSKTIRIGVYIGATIAVICVGRLILNQAAEGIRSVRNFKDACQNKPKI